MLGNVQEWLYELYDDYPVGSVTDPSGPSESPYRMTRGGFYLLNASFIRAADRSEYNREPRPEGYPGIGIRPVRTLP